MATTPKPTAKVAAKKPQAKSTAQAKKDPVANEAKPKKQVMLRDVERPDGASRIGRPAKLTPDMIEQTEKLCRIGATDFEIAHFFGVTNTTLTRWKLDNPAFNAAVRSGKEHADQRVERSLFARAVGFQHPAIKIFFDMKTGKTVEHHYVEHFPPDVTACQFWLKNRRPDIWREHYDNPGLDPQEAALLAQEAMAKAMATTAPGDKTKAH